MEDRTESRIHTHSFFPKEVILSDALEPLKAELRKLQGGITVFDVLHQKEVIVYGAVSTLIADHPQACLNSRMLGTGAIMQRASWTSKENRLQVNEDLPSYSMTRRSAQTAVVVEEMKEMIKEGKGKEDVEKRTGVHAGVSPFHDAGFPIDEHLQSPFEPCHMFHLMLTPLMATYVIESLNRFQKKLLEAAFRYVSYSSKFVICLTFRSFVTRPSQLVRGSHLLE